jgi:hypothetical protein
LITKIESVSERVKFVPRGEVNEMAWLRIARSLHRRRELTIIFGCFGIAAASLWKARPVLGDLIVQLDQSSRMTLLT